MSRFVLSLIVLLSLISFAFAQGIDELEIVTSVLDPWDEVSGISSTINGDTTYIAVATGETGARVYRVGPNLVTELVYNFNDIHAFGVFFSSGALYVAAGWEGLHIYSGVPFDLSYASTLALSGFCQAAHKTYAVNNLYVAAGEEGMHVVDVSSNYGPQLRGTFANQHGNDAVDVDGWGNYAMLANGDNGMYIIDVSDPSNPSLADTYNTECYEVVCNGSADYAYYASATGGDWDRLYWLDLTDVNNIAIHSNLPFNNDMITGIEASGSIGYATLASGQFFRFWADNQQNLVKEDSLMIDNLTDIVLGASSKPYVLDEKHGMRHIDVSNPPTFVDHEIVEADGHVFSATEYENYAFVSTTWGGIHTIDMMDPENPVEVAHFCQDVEAYLSFVDGNHLWVNATPYFRCYDVTDPANPVLVGETSSSVDKWVTPYVLDGKLIYKSSFSALGIVDVSDPSNIGDHVQYTLPDNAELSYLFVDHEYVYTTHYDDMFRIYDITDVNNIVEVASIAAGWAPIVERRGNLLYLLGTSWPSTLKIMDISDVSNPVIVGETTFLGSATWGAHVAGDYLFEPSQSTQMDDTFVFDISDPTNPVEVTTFDTKRCRSVSSYGQYLGIPDVNGFNIWNASDYLDVLAEELAKTPSTFEIASIYPNPFNPSATITIDAKVASQVKVTVFDIQGRLVATLHDGQLSAGSHSLQFDGSNLASGSYFVKAVAQGQGHRLQRMTLVK